MKLILLLVLYFIMKVNGYTVNNKEPIIGILTQPSTGKNEQFGYQFILANYIKFIEASGGRVVPIIFDKSEDEIIELLSQLNGVLLPGGGVIYDEQKLYTSRLYTIWNYILESNTNGYYYPLWGTCLGFEELSMVTAGTEEVITKFNSTNYSIPLNFTGNPKKSKLFNQCPPNLIKSFSVKPITYNYHSLGISPTTFKNNKNLTNMFNVLATNNDKNGKEFISAMESKKYPIYAIMWHPEKAANTFNEVYKIDHSFDSILSSQYLSNFFISECRKSINTFKDNTTLLNSLIFNYSPIYTYNVTGIEQTYYFNKN